MKVPDHLEGEGALLLKNFVNPGALSDYANQSAGIFTLLLETKLDGFDGIGQVYRVVFPLIGLN